MNDLIANIDRLHTTELGAQRVKRNLRLETDDVVGWCKQQISSCGAVVEKSGKNRYVAIGDIVITVNAGSYTIITAHRIKER